MPPTDTSREQHFRALVKPTQEELPVVLLMESALLLARRHGQDVVLRDAPVRVLLALRVLLDGLPGDRLDGGLIASFIRHYLYRCNFDPEREVYRDG